MHKRASIAVSALVSLFSVASPVVAGEQKKSVALVPYMVPAPMPPRPVQVRPAAGRSATASNFKKYAASSYPANHLQRGLYLKQQGDGDRALVEFLRAAQENPLQVQAFYEQAMIFKQKGYPKLAQSALQQALAVRPDFRDARVLLASLYLESGDLSHATKELVRSLGIDMERKPAVTRRSAEAPGLLASIVQTPHGRLPVPHELTAAQPAATDNASGRASNPTGTNAVAPTVAAPLAAAPAVDAFAEQNTHGSYRVQDIGGPQSSDEELLKKILGITPPKSSVVEDSSAVPHVPGQSSDQKAQHGDELGDHPTPAGVEGAKVISASNDQAEQLLKQMRTSPAKKNAGNFSWFNPFSWFDGSSGGAKPPAMTAGNALVKRAEERAKQQHGIQRTRKPRVAAWLDDVLDNGRVQPQKPRSELAMILPAPAGGQFNPVRAWTAAMPPAPVAAPLTDTVPSPVPAGGLHAAGAPLPTLGPQASGASFSNAAPTPLTLPPSRLTNLAALPAPRPVSHQSQPLRDLLNMLPKPFANLSAFFPQPVPVPPARHLDVPLPQPVGLSRQATAVAVQSLVPGMSKGVYDNLVSARVSAASMPEAALPPTPPLPPPVAQQAKYDPAALPPKPTAVLAQPGAPLPGAVQHALTSGQEVEAQLAKVGVYVPPPQPRPGKKLTPQEAKLAGQGFRFVAPQLIDADQQYAVSAARAAAPSKPEVTKAPSTFLPIEDEWTRRMQYLLRHGTANMNPGEAFMFSEESGEGVIFLTNGSSIRRRIAAARDHEEVVKLRRPDIYNAQGELQYNLSLLGKIIKPAPSIRRPDAPLRNTNGSVDDMLDRSDGIFSWLKNVLKM